MSNTIPKEFNTLTAHLVVNDAVKAIEFYKKAFNATEMCCLKTPQGGVIHASVQIGNSMLMLAEENKQWGSASPLTLKNSPVTIHLYSEDVDAAFKQAVDAGATPVMPPADMFWGDRYSRVNDPFGHQWSIAMHVKEPTAEDIEKGIAECAKMCEAVPG